MKKLSVLTYIFIITGFINAATNLPNVSVLKFKGKGVSENDAEGISDLFAVALVNSQKYSVLNRENMQDILAEQSFQASGCTDEACAVQIGRLLNMDYMFTGSAIKIASKFYITVNMVSINSGRIVRSAKSPGIQLENVEAGLRELLIRFHTGKETARAAADSPKPDGASPNRL
ncbi:MAG TPA: CsgG/HfaB family protein, partial [Spirochaetota bacterium]|nr:CsgG/HfaB family protein [Spirochaetota bacterium]